MFEREDTDSGPTRDREDSHEEGAGVGPEATAGSEAASTGLDLDGETTLNAGVQGGLTHEGKPRESERRSQDWEPFVEVDQPVQHIDS